MGSLVNTSNLPSEEPASLRSITPTHTSESTYGKLCVQDGCMRGMRDLEDVTGLPNNIAALCFDYASTTAHGNVKLCAHTIKGEVKGDEQERVTALIQRVILDPPKNTAAVRNPLFLYFNEVRASETTKQTRLEELCQALSQLKEDDVACATELTKQLRDELKPILAETLAVDPHDIHEATEMTALSYVLPKNSEMVTAIDAVTTNYIANLIAP